MSKVFPYSYLKKRTVKTKDAKVSIMCKAIQYGLGCFTGVRGFYNKQDQNLYLFRLEAHYKRLKEASNILGMKFRYTYPQFKKLLTKLCKKNKVREDIYIRPTLYSGSNKLTPRFDNPDDDLAIYMISLKNYFNSEKGLNVCISSWRRFDDDSLSTKAKITGAYANSALAKTEAVQNGYDEAIFLNRDGKVCEASGANIFAIKDGVVFTPPLSANNLNGITRKTIIELYQSELDIKVREENFDRSQLYSMDELYFTGTAAKMAFIASVDKRKIGNGKKGPLTKKMEKLFTEITTHKNDKYAHLLTPIY